MKTADYPDEYKRKYASKEEEAIDLANGLLQEAQANLNQAIMEQDEGFSLAARICVAAAREFIAGANKLLAGLLQPAPPAPESTGKKE